MTSPTQLRVKFVAGGSESDLVFEQVITEGTRVAEILQQIRLRRSSPVVEHFRIIFAGKELRPHDLLGPLLSGASPTSLVLHCMITDRPPPHQPQYGQQYGGGQPAGPLGVGMAPAATGAGAPADMLDVVGPGTVLVVILGCTLGACWLLLYFRAHLFDRLSVTLLTLLTAAFLVPCLPTSCTTALWGMLGPPPQRRPATSQPARAR